MSFVRFSVRGGRESRAESTHISIGGFIRDRPSLPFVRFLIFDSPIINHSAAAAVAAANQVFYAGLMSGGEGREETGLEEEERNAIYN